MYCQIGCTTNMDCLLFSVLPQHKSVAAKGFFAVHFKRLRQNDTGVHEKRGLLGWSGIASNAAVSHPKIM